MIPAPSPSSSPIATTVTVILTFQGTPQSGVTVTESATYNYTTNTPGASVVAGATDSSGKVNLAIGNPSVQYCFSASYTPAGQTTAINVANCQPSVVAAETITLGN
ncbi:MAG: hypothetical protein M3126_10920 [Candidatus Eremiobacteraeota bacterium]|nr:hypothetical protein [Candidatus Eremiobacteraeota bacterium]